jgi:branched-chain amino acid aminotransferase
MNTNALCWIDQSIIPARDAAVSVYDHGLLYGDGIFEGLRFYHGRVFMLEAHLQRLQESARAINLELPCASDQIASAIEQLIDAYPDDNGYLRLVVTRGPGSLGIDPRKCERPGIFIIADELAVVDVSDISHGIGLHVAQTRRMPVACLDPKIKSLNYLNNILAKIEANRAGMDEALMLNLEGQVCEGSVDNIFIVSEGELVTPPLSDGMLAGITRRVIIEAATENGIPCRQASLRLEDLKTADECFLTGTGAELIAVNRIDDHVFCAARSPLLPTLATAFKNRIAQYCGKE